MKGKERFIKQLLKDKEKSICTTELQCSLNNSGYSTIKEEETSFFQILTDKVRWHNVELFQIKGLIF